MNCYHIFGASFDEVGEQFLEDGVDLGFEVIFYFRFFSHVIIMENGMMTVMGKFGSLMMIKVWLNLMGDGRRGLEWRKWNIFIILLSNNSCFKYADSHLSFFHDQYHHFCHISIFHFTF